MFSLFGAPALSQFRLDHSLRLLRRRRTRASRRCPPAGCTSSMQRGPWPIPNSTLLEKLLTYGPRAAAPEHRGQRVLVTPRVGTESPWSSKATDILHVCGLEAVTRVERGTVYFIEAPVRLEHAEL